MISVEVTVHGEGGKRVGFGSLSFLPVTEREALLAELCALLAEMVRPGEPSARLEYNLEIDPYELGLGLVPENLVWIGRQGRTNSRDHVPFARGRRGLGKWMTPCCT